MNITNLIDTILSIRNMSRRQLAIDAKIPPSSFQSAMERGDFSISMLKKIADTLQVPMNSLISDEEDKNINFIAIARLAAALNVPPSILTDLPLATDVPPQEDSDLSPEKLREIDRRLWLLTNFEKLNELGKDTANIRIEELTQLQKYQKQKN